MFIVVIGVCPGVDGVSGAGIWAEPGVAGAGGAPAPVDGTAAAPAVDSADSICRGGSEWRTASAPRATSEECSGFVGCADSGVGGCGCSCGCDCDCDCGCGCGCGCGCSCDCSCDCDCGGGCIAASSDVDDFERLPPDRSVLMGYLIFDVSSTCRPVGSSCASPVKDSPPITSTRFCTLTMVWPERPNGAGPMCANMNQR